MTDWFSEMYFTSQKDFHLWLSFEPNTKPDIFSSLLPRQVLVCRNFTFAVLMIRDPNSLLFEVIRNFAAINCGLVMKSYLLLEIQTIYTSLPHLLYDLKEFFM